MILTEWNAYRNLDLKRIKNSMKGKLILDTRNVLSPKHAKVWGFVYEGVGRR